jgi:hypothetical protein
VELSRHQNRKLWTSAREPTLRLITLGRVTVSAGDFCGFWCARLRPYTLMSAPRPSVMEANVRYAAAGAVPSATRPPTGPPVLASGASSVGSSYAATIKCRP